MKFNNIEKVLQQQGFRDLEDAHDRLLQSVVGDETKERLFASLQAIIKMSIKHKHLSQSYQRRRFQ